MVAAKSFGAHKPISSVGMLVRLVEHHCFGVGVGGRKKRVPSSCRMLLIVCFGGMVVVTLLLWSKVLLVFLQVPSNTSSLLTTSKPCQSFNPHRMVEPGIEAMPRWIVEYVKSHRNCNVGGVDQVSLIQSESADMTIAKRGGQGGTQKFLWWVCRDDQACGGLGDRLYGFVMAFYIALLTNRTLIFDGWPHQGRETVSNFLQPALLPFSNSHMISSGWTTTSAEKRSLERIKIVDNRNHPVLLEPCRALDSHVPMIELQNNIMTYEQVLRNSTCFQRYCQPFGNCMDDNRRSLFHIGFWTLFRFTNLVKEQAGDLRQMAGLRPAQPYIAMHVRTGQGETWDDPPRHKDDSDLKMFLECSLKLQRRVQQHCGTPAPLIYIAADNTFVKKRIQRWDTSNTVKAATSKNEMEILHIGKSRVREFQNLDLAYRRVWGELKVLIDSTCIVMSRSKFSYMGAELSPQQPRCALLFDQCGDAEVDKAITTVTCG